MRNPIILMLVLGFEHEAETWIDKDSASRQILGMVDKG
jgi:hypothetical protein